jgi:hypothetical protein
LAGHTIRVLQCAAQAFWNFPNAVGCTASGSKVLQFFAPECFAPEFKRVRIEAEHAFIAKNKVELDTESTCSKESTIF